ncbi:transcription factor IBH1 [Ricinus communis]|uniref:Transcription factor, putative n=1 Tax=Ricinus communis TaxID=3988 RepID=B9SMN9_RICCO|nr:transcription factor IBH1 [Ricinus communis]EEF35102.1 transcription factor, putative [Ricinus communis]|eukprot:XP_015579729.1 transcription factor IBH1 [Ricinus communis]
MNHPHQCSLNPNSLKSRFTKGFLRSLLKINRQRVRNNIPSCSSPGEFFERCHRVKTAADKSLAFAVGRRRAWSRAMLFKIRNRARRRRRQHCVLVKRINHHQAKKIICLKKEQINDEEAGFDQASKLRKLVPGSEGMDLCSLLDEAAHYIECLNTQVQVMRSIADLCST